jgi:hypothetical protein
MIMTDSSPTYSASEAAAKLGTDPKTLRRFLRANDSYRNVGSGARYVFQTKDIDPLEKSFKAWKGLSRSKSTKPGNAKSKDPVVNTNRAKERVDAMELSLKERGVHISQHTDEPQKGHNGWDTEGLEECCDICQEPMPMDDGETGEFKPDIGDNNGRPVIAHAQCGLDMGLELA